MTRCALRRCKWAKEGHCLFMLSRGWCPNQRKRIAEEKRLRRQRALRAAEHAEFMEMLRRVCGAESQP